MTPIVFIHYGNASYLRRTLLCAVRTTPAATTILLGDQSNRNSCSSGVEFVDLRDYEDAPSVVRFRKVFQPIEGKRHRFNKLGGTTLWLEFVFKRWFIIRELLRHKRLDSFWTFDSDTLLLAPLDSRSERFAKFASTTQCYDNCLNGFVGSRALVEDYTDFILELFEDKDYLAAQRTRLEDQSGLAFNEMDAFCEFRRHKKVDTFHAARPLHGEFFDDALAYDKSFEPAPHKIRGNITVKRLWRDCRGAVYAHHLESDCFVRMITANLSWLPDYVGRKLARFSLTPEQDAEVVPPKKTELQEIDLSQPMTDKIMTALKKRLYEAKKKLGR